MPGQLLARMTGDWLIQVGIISANASDMQEALNDILIWLMVAFKNTSR